MRLLYLSPVPWRSFDQRPHSFVQWFHRRTGARVMWVEPYPTRLPRFKDLRRPAIAGVPSSRDDPPWLEVLRPRSLPIEPLAGADAVNRLLWRDAFQACLAFADPQTTVVGIGKPSAFALDLLRRLEGRRSFYDAMDDFSAFYRGISRRALARCERRIVEQVTDLFVSSTELARRWERVRLFAARVPNGLSSAALPAPVLRRGPRQRYVLGYVGTIGEWFDWRWIAALARVRRADLVRVIGPLFTPPPISLPDNVSIEGPLAHAKAIAAMRSFDVGLIPFKANALTASVDPIKYYEYHALGLPVISSPFGEMLHRRRDSGVFLCAPANLDRIVEQALAYRPNEAEIRRFRAENDWDRRFLATGLLDGLSVQVAGRRDSDPGESAFPRAATSLSGSAPAAAAHRS